MSTISLTFFKTCTKCGCTKPATANFFHRQKKQRHGVRPDCKVCISIYHRERSKEDPNRYRGYSRAYYEANKEQVLLRMRERYNADPKAKLASNKAWAKSNPDKIAAILKKYRDANQDKIRAVTKAYRYAHKEERAAYAKKYREENLEAVRAATRRWCARLRNAEGRHTGEDVIWLYEGQGGKCYWCNKPLNGEYHVDHIIPLSKGGSDWPANICCACPFCNISKRDKMPWEFSDRLF